MTMTSLGTTNHQKNMIKVFEEWFNRWGIRYFSQDHGTADGHMDYMSVAFMAGYKAAQDEQALAETRQD